MPGKDEVGSEIKVPKYSGETSGVASNEDLLSAQDSLFSKKETKEPEENEQPSQTPKPDRATEIFNKTRQTTEKLNGHVKGDSEAKRKGKEAPEEEVEKEVEADEGFPEFDPSQFLTDSTGETEVDLEPGEDDEEETTEETEEEVEVDFSKERNIKNLKKIAGTFKQERDELKAKVQALEAQAQKADVRALQNKIQSLEGRVKELEPFEYTFALHQNPEFKKKYVEGSKAIVEEIKQIASDYEANEAEVDTLMGIRNRRELDEALETLFGSSTNSAATDVKNLKRKYDALQTERSKEEQNAGEALRKFQTEEETNKAERNQRRDLHLKNMLQTGWTSALSGLDRLSDNQKIPELVEIPGKKDHNEKVARPTLNHAQQLMQNGLNYIERMAREGGVMNAEFASWFAGLCQQAAATQMINQTRYGLWKKYQQLQQDYSEQRQMSRPGINPPSRTASGKKKKGEKKSPIDIAAEIWSETVG